MEFTLFYAWQSDLPLDDNKHLIRDAAKTAVKNVCNADDIVESPRLDQDTRGLSGMPSIADSIFEKIGTAGMFLGDVTFVGSSDPHEARATNASPYKNVDSVDEHFGSVEFVDGSVAIGGLTHKKAPAKKLMNPNVAIELGFAAKAMGWGRIILVMNTAYGGLDEIPFDIRHRRNPVDYHFRPGSSSRDRKAVKESLASKLGEYIRDMLKGDHAEVGRLVSRLDVNCMNLMKRHGSVSYFADPNPNSMIYGGAQDTSRFTGAVIRLLDLGLLRAHFDPTSSRYAYHWTYFGRLALTRLNIQQR